MISIKIYYLGLLTLASCIRTSTIQTKDPVNSSDHKIVQYVNSIDYDDVQSLHGAGAMTERMVELVKLMQVSDSASVRDGLDIFLNGMKRDARALSMVDSLANLYLNNPASPVRDENGYIAYLESLLSLDSIPENIREIGEESLRIAMLNRPGTLATDFRYLDRNGTKHSLHETIAEELLLVFYDPECTHCSEILESIAQDSNISESIATGKMKVLAIYAEGKRDVWEKTKMEMPLQWIVGYDLSDILDNDLYDLPAMPTIYLLDKNKKVKIKDAMITL